MNHPDPWVSDESWVSDPVDAPWIPPTLRPAGLLAGIPLVENPHLKYDEMAVSGRGVVVGEIRHFRWRLEQLQANNRCRGTARQHIERTASRILGEPWTVADK
jgi:hypothetical protein